MQNFGIINDQNIFIEQSKQVNTSINSYITIYFNILPANQQ